MQITPRYDGPPLLSVDDVPGSRVEAVVRQRRRFADLLGRLSEEQWAHPSRCDAWSVRDVVAHLVSVNEFWSFSIACGLAGEPTTMLAGFDPAASPAALVDAMGAMGASEVYERFVATNEAFISTLSSVTGDQWSATAEAPPGHLPIHLVSQHALWDSWVHERDVALPLGIEPEVQADEVAATLRYAAAVSPMLALAVGEGGSGRYAVDARDPDDAFVLDIGESVSLVAGPPDGRPCLSGDAVGLVEALSLRAPMPDDAPPEWVALLGGLRVAFDADDGVG